MTIFFQGKKIFVIFFFKECHIIGLTEIVLLSNGHISLNIIALMLGNASPFLSQNINCRRKGDCYFLSHAFINLLNG